MSFDSVDLDNPIDQEKYQIHTDNDDGPTSTSHITPPPSPPSP